MAFSPISFAKQDNFRYLFLVSILFADHSAGKN